MSDRLAELLEDCGQVLEPSTEIEVDAATIHAAIEMASAAAPKTALGGSAFMPCRRRAQGFGSGHPTAAVMLINAARSGRAAATTSTPPPMI
ncbi:hypothetical protein [Nocardia sp. NPDC046763]|uniref:hypothetical protein n=1 Tax=Nocardia sp. NPDC046763 TaxID=3155256 RepID=UPI00340DEA06